MELDPFSAFHPAVARWFRRRLGEPTRPQREGWPAIRRGRHVLIAAPTGTGKTLAAFLWALDELLREGAATRGGVLPDATRVLYVSPLKALGNDVQKNLRAPLAELRELDPSLPEVRVLVRSGDTPPHQRAAMTRRPPHILVTTPESLYILLTSEGGRAMLRTVRTAIVDEIHAVVGDKRGCHLALSLERLEALVAGSRQEDEPAAPSLRGADRDAVQRIGLSATQKPLEAVARFLSGVDRPCTLVDAGHLRDIDLDIEVPLSPLSTVCSHEVWEEIYARMAELVRAHRTTLVFVNTRRMAERVAAQLAKILGEEVVTCHHGSLSREHRLEAEERLKAGKLRALVATASLELGIDIGDVDLVLQAGSIRSIATCLQRVGRAGHGVGRRPKGRLFPLTQEELVEAAALVRLVRAGELDEVPHPAKPIDILVQQAVAACVPETWEEERLLACFRRAWPYRELTRREFDGAVSLVSGGRRALLHRDGVNGRLRATRGARITAMTGGGAIPDNADYAVRAEPDGTFIGTLNEDFAVESSAGDIFQLGNASWLILRVESGLVRVADAEGAPPTLPFWLGEAPARTRELSAAVGELREEARSAERVRELTRVPEEAAEQIVEFVAQGRSALGAVPTQRRVIAERFFDEAGGMQMVIHAPFGGRVNRAWGLALRKKICRGFGFELQSAASEDAILFSLGPQTSFPLEEVFTWISPESARRTLVQALLPTPMFQTRWRWNVSRALLVPRMTGGKRLPAPLARMRSDDLLAQAFPEVIACPENLPPGDLPVPMDHPLVRQTIEDCLSEAMDVDGLVALLRGIREGEIETRAVDTPEPSAFARAILNSQPYTFLDDAPLEERRSRAVRTRRALDPRQADEIGALDPEAVARVREEAWPDPRDVEELHEALLWMGYATAAEAEAHGWSAWMEELVADGRAVREEGAGEARYHAAEASRDPLDALRGRMEALGPVESDDPLMLRLENGGHVLRARMDGKRVWCDRRLLARIHHYTLDRLRREIEPVTTSQFLRFLASWQHVEEDHRLDGPRGVAEAVRQLAGFEAPAAAWEGALLPLRVRGYKQEWLDAVTLSGEMAWGRLWGSGAAAVRTTPVCLLAREELDRWLALAGPSAGGELTTYARAVFDVLRARGAAFQLDIARETRLLPDHLEMGLAELIGLGLATCDSFSGLRQLLTPPHRRRHAVATSGRWSLLRDERAAPASSGENARSRQPERDAEFVALTLLRRYGVVFRRLLTRERQPVPWRDLVRVYRRLELRGEVRGGRFVGRFPGEQFALPDAVSFMRKVRRAAETARGAGASGVAVSAADPLNLRGILTPDERVSSLSKQRVRVA